MVDSEMRIAVILPAAGRSRRFAAEGGRGNKLDSALAGRAVLVRSVELFSSLPAVHQIIVAVSPDDLDRFKFRYADTLGFLGVRIVAGGETERWETVRNGLAAVEDEATHIAVHDAARPLTDPAVIRRVFEAAKRYDAVVPAVAVSDTLKRAEASATTEHAAGDPLDAILGGAGKEEIPVHRVTETVSRDDLWAVQTPQVFRRDLLSRAYERIGDGESAGGITDDAGLVEHLGEPVYLVEGDALNWKITRPSDLALAEAILAMRSGKGPDDALGSKRKFPTWAESDDDE